MREKLQALDVCDAHLSLRKSQTIAECGNTLLYTEDGGRVIPIARCVASSAFLICATMLIPRQ
ncbi:hypothetical protein [Pantoea sp. BAV 3049]|uniref:hypothetical protein n=1 Tax=Pantoea sp. BAV 3049 TaxID=2654188 RepID=UPI00131BBA1F|nr:hypothetical protein [Pantoea sp. BAV 3049]